MAVQLTIAQRESLRRTLYETFLACLRPKRDAAPYFTLTPVTTEAEAKTIVDALLPLATNLREEYARANARTAQLKQHVTTFTQNASADLKTRIKFVFDGAHTSTDILRIYFRPFASLLNVLDNDFARPPVTHFSLVEFIHLIPDCVVDYTLALEPQVPPDLRPPERKQPAMAAIQQTLSPPTFAGSIQEDVKAFIDRLKRFFAAVENITPEQKLCYLELQCKGPALELLDREIRHLETLNPRKTKEEEFAYLEDCLTKHFDTKHYSQEYKDQLEARVKLPTESYSIYCQSVLQLCHKAGITDPKLQIAELSKGLEAHICMQVRSKEAQTVNDFVADVLACEYATRRWQRTHAAANAPSLPSFPPAAPAFSAAAALDKPSPSAATRPSTELVQILEKLDALALSIRKAQTNS